MLVFDVFLLLAYYCIRIILLEDLSRSLNFLENCWDVAEFRVIHTFFEKHSLAIGNTHWCCLYNALHPIIFYRTMSKSQSSAPSWADLVEEEERLEMAKENMPLRSSRRSENWSESGESDSSRWAKCMNIPFFRHFMCLLLVFVNISIYNRMNN